MRNLGMDPPLCIDCDGELEVDIDDSSPPKMVTHCPTCHPPCTWCGDDAAEDSQWCSAKCEREERMEISDYYDTFGWRGAR